MAGCRVAPSGRDDCAAFGEVTLFDIFGEMGPCSSGGPRARRLVAADAAIAVT